MDCRKKMRVVHPREYHLSEWLLSRYGLAITLVTRSNFAKEVRRRVPIGVNYRGMGKIKGISDNDKPDMCITFSARHAKYYVVVFLFRKIYTHVEIKI